MARNKVIIASDGYITQVYVNGKVYGEGIVGIKFEHNAGKVVEAPELTISVSDLPINGEENIAPLKDFINKLFGEAIQTTPQTYPIPREKGEKAYENSQPDSHWR